jgi:hypothetical protein
VVVGGWGDGPERHWQGWPRVGNGGARARRKGIRASRRRTGAAAAWGWELNYASHSPFPCAPLRGACTQWALLAQVPRAAPQDPPAHPAPATQHTTGPVYEHVRAPDPSRRDLDASC